MTYNERIVYNPAFGLLVDIYNQLLDEKDPIQNLCEMFDVVSIPCGPHLNSSMVERTYREIEADIIYHQLWPLHLDLLSKWISTLPKDEQSAPAHFYRALTERVFDGPPLRLSDHYPMQTFFYWCHSQLQSKRSKLSIPEIERRCEGYILLK